uniref:Uncharacterized protein n=1 Tax=Dicentrarchus labrax TaxID=13489 RepID=A0A8C4NN68_DICLA
VAVMENLFLQTPSTTTLLGTVGILLALYIFFPRFDPQRKEPPGPKPLLLFGNSLQLDPKSPHIYINYIFILPLFQLSKKYGPVFTFHFGPKKVVVLAGYKTIKQALLNNDAFSERDILPIINDLKLTHGIVFANGDSWKEMRHFALTNLKVFGMGKKACEEKIIEESQHLIHVFNKKDGKQNWFVCEKTLKLKKKIVFNTTLPVNYAILTTIIY